jgi:hypothetical protein
MSRTRYDSNIYNNGPLSAAAIMRDSQFDETKQHFDSHSDFANSTGGVVPLHDASRAAGHH